MIQYAKLFFVLLLFGSNNLMAQKDTLFISKDPWFFGDTTFFCKYSSVKKLDFFFSDNRKKMLEARQALDREDAQKLGAFRWPAEATPGWKVAKPHDGESYIRTYFLGDTNHLQVLFQLEVKFIKGSTTIIYHEKKEEFSSEFRSLLKFYYEGLKVDRENRRQKVDAIKSFEKRFQARQDQMNEGERVLFEPWIPYSERRVNLKSVQVEADTPESLELQIWLNPYQFPRKLHYWYKEKQYQKLHDILVKTGLNRVDAFGGYSIKEMWWNTKFQLGFFDEIVEEGKKGNYKEPYFESLYRSKEKYEPELWSKFKYIPYEYRVFLGDENGAFEMREALKKDKDFADLEAYLKEHGEGALRPQYFAYHYTILESYEKAFHFHGLAKDQDGQARVLLLSQQYDRAIRFCDEILNSVLLSPNKKARFLCYLTMATILNTSNARSARTQLEIHLEKEEVQRDLEFDTVLLEGWIKHYLTAPSHLKNEVAIVLSQTMEKINVEPRR